MFIFHLENAKQWIQEKQFYHKTLIGGDKNLKERPKIPVFRFQMKINESNERNWKTNLNAAKQTVSEDTFIIRCHPTRSDKLSILILI